MLRTDRMKSETEGTNTRSRLRPVAITLLLLTSAALLALSLVRFIPDVGFPLELATHFQMQYLLVAGGATVLAFALSQPAGVRHRGGRGRLSACRRRAGVAGAVGRAHDE